MPVDRIENTPEKIKEMIKDLFIIPRNLMDKWSRITNQTPQVRIAYPGQHLASMVTGIKGGGTAARGDDLSDGTEVKTCSRADQLGICKNCGSRVMRNLEKCQSCDSDDIDTKEDSHWIFSIRSDTEFEQLLKLPRLLLVLFDRDSENFINIRIWQVNPNDPYVKGFFTNYYVENYKAKISSGNSKPAPCNLHPLKYDFYMMNPILIFHTIIKGEEIIILKHNMNESVSEEMPTVLLKTDEIKMLETLPELRGNYRNKKEFIEKFPKINQTIRAKLVMRNKKTKTNKTAHIRFSQKEEEHQQELPNLK